MPPIAAIRLLERCLPPEDRDDIVGDLIQTFADRADDGRSLNRLWFWGQAVLFAAASLVPAPVSPHDAPDRRFFMDGFRTRLRDARRHLRHDWRYACGVILILGAGLGPAASMMTVVDTVLLKPLDYADPDRLAMVRIDLDTLRGHPGLSPAESLDLRRSGLFDAVETQTRLAEVTLAQDDRLIAITNIGMTPGLLPMLGVRPVIGRLLVDDDLPPPPPPQARPGPALGDLRPLSARPPGPPPPPPTQPALIDFDMWHTHFGGDAGVLGRIVVVDGRSTEIVGVLPRGFRLATGRAVPQRVDLYTPFALRDFRNAWQFPTLARLRPGDSFERVQTALDALATDLKRQYPEFYPGTLRFTIAPVLSDMTDPVRPALRAALAAVFLVLLIACVNAAALVVAKLRTREQDFAIRQAIGANRRSLAAQVLAESAYLAAGATLVGGVFAALTMIGIREVIPRTVPRWDALEVGWPLVAWAGLFAFAGLLFTGLALVWRVSRVPVLDALRSGSMQGGRAEGTASRLVLAGAQMALTVMLAFGCIQLARSAVNLGRVDLGFDPNVLTLRVGYDFRLHNSRELRAELYQRIRDRVSQVPGVVAAGVTTHVPLSGSTMMDGYEADLSKEPSFAQAANYQGVTAGYFESLRIPIVLGRDFTVAEAATAQAVVVVDQTLVDTVFPGERDVIGRTLRLGWGLENARIIGVVGHVRSIEVGRAVRPQVYTTVANLFQVQNGGIVTVRTTGDAMAARPAIEAAIREVGPGRAIGQVAMLSANVDAALSTLRAVTGLIGLLAISASALSAAGLYIVIAYLIHERRRSAAIRTALGATRGQVIWAYLRNGGVAAAVAVVVGAVGSLAAATLFGGLLHGVAVRDAGSLLLAMGIVALISGVAMWLPARRAAAANVIKVLREA